MGVANSNIEPARVNDTRENPAITHHIRHDSADRCSEVLNRIAGTTRNPPMFSGNCATSMGRANPFSDVNKNGDKYNELSNMMLEYIPGLEQDAKTEYRDDPWKMSKVDRFYSILKAWLKKVIKDKDKIQGFQAGEMKKCIGYFKQRMECVDAEERKGDSSNIEYAKAMVERFIDDTNSDIKKFK